MKFLKLTYGFDLLSLALLLLSFILNLFKYTRPVSYFIIFIIIFRALSNKIYKRKQELNYFIGFLNKILSKFNLSIPYNTNRITLDKLDTLFNSFKNKITEFKNYKITKCPKCKQKLRLPRKKGNIIVTCSSCKTKFDFKT